MQTAVRAGVQYAIAGGTDTTEAEKRADAGWTRKPTGGTITAARECKCETANWDCRTPCDTKLQEFMTVTAKATLGGFVYSMNKTTTETVRIR
jgi:hypothetical protein